MKRPGACGPRGFIQTFGWRNAQRWRLRTCGATRPYHCTWSGRVGSTGRPADPDGWARRPSHEQLRTHEARCPYPGKILTRMRPCVPTTEFRVVGTPRRGVRNGGVSVGMMPAVRWGCLLARLRVSAVLRFKCRRAGPRVPTIELGLVGSARRADRQIRTAGGPAVPTVGKILPRLRRAHG